MGSSVRVPAGRRAARGARRGGRCRLVARVPAGRPLGGRVDGDRPCGPGHGRARGAARRHPGLRSSGSLGRDAAGVPAGSRGDLLVTAVAGTGSVDRTALPQRTLLERIVAHAHATPAIVGLLVFGSFATGTEDGQSDLDLGLYVADEAWPSFDLREWLEPVAAVAAVRVTEHGSIVLFRDLVRAEVHLGTPDLADVWPSLAGVIAYPSLERMVRLDRTGRFTAAVEPLIGRLPDRTHAELEDAFLGLTD